MYISNICKLYSNRYGGRYTVTMMPGDGIGPEMTGYIREVFREVGAPVDFETVDLDPTTDNYDDLHNVSNLFSNFKSLETRMN